MTNICYFCKYKLNFVPFLKKQGLVFSIYNQVNVSWFNYVYNLYIYLYIFAF